MRTIDADELARMAAAQVSSFNDSATLFRVTHYQDSNTGQLSDSFDSGALLVCGLATGPEFRNERGQVVTLDADAVLRVAASQSIGVGDRVVARGVTYSVDGVQPGRNVQIVKLQEIKV